MLKLSIAPAIQAKSRFPMGNLYATQGALKALHDAETGVVELLERHLVGDWGDLCEEDRQENEYSVDKRLRLLSAYNLPTGEKIWIITEADRSITTLLTPVEY